MSKMDLEYFNAKFNINENEISYDERIIIERLDSEKLRELIDKSNNEDNMYVKSPTNLMNAAMILSKINLKNPKTIEKVADIFDVLEKQTCYMTYDNHITALMVCARYNNYTLGKHLLKYEANFCTKEGCTALMVACANNNIEMVELLAPYESGLHNINKFTAMSYIYKFNTGEDLANLIKALITQGPNPRKYYETIEATNFFNPNSVIIGKRTEIKPRNINEIGVVVETEKIEYFLSGIPFLDILNSKNYYISTCLTQFMRCINESTYTKIKQEVTKMPCKNPIIRKIKDYITPQEHSKCPLCSEVATNSDIQKYHIQFTTTCKCGKEFSICSIDDHINSGCCSEIFVDKELNKEHKEKVKELIQCAICGETIPITNLCHHYSKVHDLVEDISDDSKEDYDEYTKKLLCDCGLDITNMDINERKSHLKNSTLHKIIKCKKCDGSFETWAYTEHICD